MTIFTLRIDIPIEKRDEIERAIQSIVEPTGTLPGCLSCRLCRETGHAEFLVLYEEWSSSVELDRHIRSDAFRKILDLTEMAISPPEFKFYTVASTGGIEVIEKLRTN